MSILKFATADIEANEWIDFTMAGFYDGENYYKFRSIKQFINKIFVKKYDGWRIYFHNGGRYDFLFYMHYVLSNYDVKFIEVSGGIISMTVSDGINKWILADSYKLLSASLETLIETFKVKHKKIKINFNVKHDYNDIRLSEHLENDCKALYEILMMFYNEYGFMKLTIASQALAIFTSEYFDGEMTKLKTKHDKYFRKNYYHGGRVEVYKGYGENLNYYDINSLYPSVMLNKMPCGKYRETGIYQKNKVGFYKVIIKQNTDFYVSPFIYTGKDKSLYYINANKGEKYFLSSVDIEYLKSSGIKLSIDSGIYFDGQDYLFNDYVDHFYKMKNENKGNFKYYIAKLFLNSLYGKFGQRNYYDKIETWTGQKNMIDIFSPEYNLVLVRTEDKSKFHLIYIAAYITSLSRNKHLELLNKVKKENLYYCDTDSIITSAKLKTDNDIGGLKLEAKIKKAVFLLPKTYSYIDSDNIEHCKIKGFEHKAFNFKELYQALKTNTSIVYTKEKILSFRECLNRVAPVKKDRGHFLKLVEFNKTLTPEYTKREIIKNKKHIFETKPLTMELLK